jgi:formylglycine-generating enzyme required for sulfatase activity
MDTAKRSWGSRLVIGGLAIALIVAVWGLFHGRHFGGSLDEGETDDEWTIRARGGGDGKGSGSGLKSAPEHSWALLVGVDKYQRIDGPDLKYCGADVRALAERLVQTGFAKERVVVMHDNAAPQFLPLKSNIVTQLQRVLGAAGEGDFVFVAFSGHGVRIQQRSYLCPYDATMEPGDLIPVNVVYKELEQCPAQFKLVLVDACQNDKTPPQDRFGTRAAGTIKAFGLGSNERLPEGILLMTSCSPGQMAIEAPEFGHGVFTHFLLQGLEGKADRDQDGKVDLLEWVKYAEDETKKYVFGKGRNQWPRYKGEFSDFPLVRLAGHATPSSEKPPVASIPPPVMPPAGVASSPPLANAPFGAEEARQHRERWAKYLNRSVEETNSIGMKLELIPPGEFLMGSPEGEKHRDSDEGPQHQVRITKPFYLGMYEVTQEQYERVMGSNPSVFKGSTRPVEHVSWEDAVKFCEKLSQQEGNRYRLPTEAEWEYGCRAGTQTRHYWGDDDSESVLKEYCWYSMNSSEGCWTEPHAEKQGTQPVGQKRANGWGLFDMSGNVWEWCQDWKDSYPSTSIEDPTGPPSGSNRVTRGGGFTENTWNCRSADRYGDGPGHRSIGQGFRVARVAAE